MKHILKQTSWIIYYVQNKIVDKNNNMPGFKTDE